MLFELIEEILSYKIINLFLYSLWYCNLEVYNFLDREIVKYLMNLLLIFVEDVICTMILRYHILHWFVFQSTMWFILFCYLKLHAKIYLIE